MNVTTNSTQDEGLSNSCVFHDDPFWEAKLFNFSLTVCIAIFGLIANSMVIAVNRKIKLPTSTDICITLVAVTDNLLICSVSLIGYRYSYRFLMAEDKVNWSQATEVALIGLLFKNFAQCLNSYTIVLLNLDRCIQVKFLSFSKSWCTSRRAGIHFICAIIGATAFTLPKLVEHGFILRNREETILECHGYFKMVGGLGFNKYYKLVYGVVIYAIVMYVVPLTMLTVTNITLISTVLQRRKWLNTIKPNSENERERQKKKNDTNTIITLLSVTIVFMLCQIPDVVLQFIWKLAPKYGPITNLITYQVVIVNSSINCLIYTGRSKAFRNRLYQIVFKCSSENVVEPYANASRLR